eukprot:11131290-Lingulodinium_polyedra.AAC.1
MSPIDLALFPPRSPIFVATYSAGVERSTRGPMSAQRRVISGVVWRGPARPWRCRRYYAGLR